MDMNSLKKILVADDDDLVRMMIRRALEIEGFDVVEADDGVVAVEMANKHPDIGIIILDLKMPRMSGKEAYEAIRKIRPDVKCIVSSAHINENDEEELSAVGISAILKKPYHIEDLYTTIHHVADESG